MLDQINAVRTKPHYCGDKRYEATHAVRWDAALAKAATAYAQALADGKTPEPKPYLQSAGYDGIWIPSYSHTSGQAEAKEAINGWTTTTFCQTLTNRDATEIAIGRGFNSQSEYGRYWVLLIGRRH